MHANTNLVQPVYNLMQMRLSLGIPSGSNPKITKFKKRKQKLSLYLISVLWVKETSNCLSSPYKKGKRERKREKQKEVTVGLFSGAHIPNQHGAERKSGFR